MLRRQGKSCREIKEILGPMSNATLNDALKDEPPPRVTDEPRIPRDPLIPRWQPGRYRGLTVAALAIS